MKVSTVRFLLLAGLFLMISFALIPVARAAAGATLAGSKVLATLRPTQGNSVQGVVMFTKEKGGVRVVAVVKGLTQGIHGFHVHEKGDCSAPDAESAGGHFNPRGNPHGAPFDVKRHAGDLGNLDANVYGNAYYEYVDPMISLDGPDSIVGRAVVVHANPDDLKTQPAGNAGARVACGVIGNP